MREGGFYTIFHQGRVVGCMKYTTLPGNQIMLEGLRMEPDERGKGYASVAVDFFMDLVHSLEPSIIRFATSDENAFSHHSADKYGFTKITSFFHRYVKGPEMKSILERIGRADVAEITQMNYSVQSAEEGDLPEILSFISGSPEWNISHGLLSSGWVFFPFTEKGVRDNVRSGFSFTCKVGKTITAVLLAHGSRQYPGDVDISWLSGSKEQVHSLLTEFMTVVDIGTVNEIAVKTPSSIIAGHMESYGFIRHDRVNCAVVFEKRLS